MCILTPQAIQILYCKQIYIIATVKPHDMIIKNSRIVLMMRKKYISPFVWLNVPLLFIKFFSLSPLVLSWFLFFSSSFTMENSEMELLKFHFRWQFIIFLSLFFSKIECQQIPAHTETRRTFKSIEWTKWKTIYQKTIIPFFPYRFHLLCYYYLFWRNKWIQLSLCWSNKNALSKSIENAIFFPIGLFTIAVLCNFTLRYKNRFFSLYIYSCMMTKRTNTILSNVTLITKIA